MSAKKKPAAVLTSRVHMPASDVELTIVKELARRGYVVAPGTRPIVVTGVLGADDRPVGAAFDRIVATVIVKPVAPRRRRR